MFIKMMNWISISNTRVIIPWLFLPLVTLPWVTIPRYLYLPRLYSPWVTLSFPWVIIPLSNLHRATLQRVALPQVLRSTQVIFTLRSLILTLSNYRFNLGNSTNSNLTLSKCMDIITLGNFTLGIYTLVWFGLNYDSWHIAGLEIDHWPLTSPLLYSSRPQVTGLPMRNFHYLWNPTSV